MKTVYSKRFEKVTEIDITKEIENCPHKTLHTDNIIKQLENNIKTIPNKERIANKDRFISAVTTLCENYEIDGDILEFDEYYKAELYFESNTTFTNNMKILLNKILLICDDFSLFETEKKDTVIFSFIYDTHDIFLGNKNIN